MLTYSCNQQGAQESMRIFMTRFKGVMSRISGISNAGAIAALKNKLWHESRFREELIINQPATIKDAMHQALKCDTAEEEKASLAKRFAAIKATPSQTNSHTQNPHPYTPKRRNNGPTPSQGNHSYP